MPKKAKRLKVMLTEENTKKIRDAAHKTTTPPKLVNHIIETTTITGLTYTR